MQAPTVQGASRGAQSDQVIRSERRVTTVNPAAITASATSSIVDGARVNGFAVSRDTMANLEAAIATHDTLALPAGTFRGTAAIGVASTLTGVGRGRTIINATGLAVYRDMAVLVVLVPGVTISNLSITGASIAETLGGNAAGVRDTANNIGFRLSDVEISGCQNGILTFGSDIEIAGGYVHDNGSGSGFTHNIYVNGNGSNFFRLSNLWTANCIGGHEIKSRAAHTISFGCHHTTGGNGSAYDIPDGGQVSISNGSMNLSKDAADHRFLGYAMESTKNQGVGNIVTITNEVFNDATGSGGIIVSNDPKATLTLSGCSYTGSSQPQIRGWAAVNGAITKAV